MHNKWLIYLSFACFSALISNATVFANTQSFEIYKIKPDQGELFYQLFSCTGVKEQQWDELEPLANQSVIAKDSRVKVAFPVMVNRACIRVFQDSNSNNQLDFGTGNIPIEPVGFSNNPNLMLGYPMPKKTVVEVDDDSSIKIKMNYRRRR